MMKTDAMIKTEGMKALLASLGMIEAERFVMLNQRESFDYTKWQENLFDDMNIDEISEAAAKHRLNTSS